ncbi:hypothetical protein MTR67_007415 [Solanum verrucosum]|uniref:Integrase catalytic domain-containing protein n=1 Tax=Solanum verrucosum TaxID=315347 RepID=A0AAF0Q1Z3_SOLVR|nr:hypothetical protein MTR67_007415 [Solanum verrucosum]
MLSIFADMVEDSLEVFIDEFSVVGDTFKEGIVWKHKILGEGIQVDQAKVEVFTKLPPPISVEGVRNFLVHAGFYQRENLFRSVYYASKTFNVAQNNYIITEQELLVVVYAFEKSIDYFLVTKVVVHTNHVSIHYLMAKKDAKPRLIRWVLLLQELDFEVRYQKGCENKVAGLMSRLEMNVVVSSEKDIKEAFPNASVIAVLNGTPSCGQRCIKMQTLLLRSVCNAKRKGGVLQRNELPLPPILEVELYDVWGINFMRPFVSSYGNKYILVAVDYVSKWVEVVSLPNNEGRSVVKFLKRYIFMRFGTPRAIISDGGSHFCNRIFTSLLKKYGVKHKVATPYHPKTIGQVKLLVLNREKDWGGDALGHFGELRPARRVYSVCCQLSSPSPNFQADDEPMLLSVMTLQLAEVNLVSR